MIVKLWQRTNPVHDAWGSTRRRLPPPSGLAPRSGRWCRSGAGRAGRRGAHAAPPAL